MDNRAENKQKLQDYLKNLNLGFDAKFQPGEYKTGKDFHSNQIKFAIRLAHEPKTLESKTAPYSTILETQYSYGIGHLKGLNLNRITMDVADSVKLAVTTGAYRPDPNKFFAQKVKTPELIDVLHCLLLDSDALDYSFEDWADNFGYSSDSIKAKGIYDACLQNAIKLRQILGDKVMTELKELYQDL